MATAVRAIPTLYGETAKSFESEAAHGYAGLSSWGKSCRQFPSDKLWIEENGQKKIDIAWSELSADEENLIIEAVDKHWEELNRLIDDVFAGKKIQIKKLKN